MSSSTFLPTALRKAAEQVSTLLRQRKETVSVAETAAGGLISASLLAMPGASAYYNGGLTLYTLPSRLAYAGWTPSDIHSYSGPTPDIVGGLAEHTRTTLQSTYGVGESGTAGPTGGTTRNRTPGYVALAISSAEGTYKTDLDTGLGGDREANMVAFAVAALELLRDVLEGKAKL